MGDTLYKVDRNGELTTSLASKLPELTNNGLTVTISLRDDIFFHDGTKFDGEAMAFTIQRFMNIGTLNYILSGRIKSIDVPEKYKIRLNLSRPSSSINGLLTSINLTPVSPKSYANHKNKFLNDNFIGTGPYKLDNFSPQQKQLKRFNLYWSTPAQNNGISFISLSNSSALFGALINGEIDVLLSNSIQEDQRKYLNTMSKKGEIVEGRGSALEIGYLTFRTNAPPFNKPIIRKAILHSLDRNLISKRVSYGLRKPLRSLVPPDINILAKSSWPKYNPYITKKLLTKAGFCNGEQLNIPLTFRSNVPADKLLALTWQAQVQRDFSECLKLSLNGVESTTIYRQLSKGAYQAVMLDWRGSYPDPEAYLSPLLSCERINRNVCEQGEAVISGSFWTDPLMENALKRSEELHGRKRLEALNKVEKIASNGGAYLPIWLLSPRAWAQKYISKPEFDSNGHLLLSRLKNINK